jgi:hypothetical protein
MIDFLSRYTRNIWTLCFRGYVDRVRELLEARPELARQSDNDGITPLWWLPDEEDKALEIVELLIAAGADPAARSREGRTAADWARTRGMLDVARRLDEAAGTAPVEPAPEIDRAPQPADLARFEVLAQDLLFAFESGNAGVDAAPAAAFRRRHLVGPAAAPRCASGSNSSATRGPKATSGSRTRSSSSRGSPGFDTGTRSSPALSARDVGDVMFPPSSRSRRRRRGPMTCRSRCAPPSRCACATTRSRRRRRCGGC